MNTNFTPGPWKVHFNVPTAIYPGHIIKQDDNVQLPICNVPEGGGTHGKGIYRANAILIAAAPELLEALCGLSEWVLRPEISDWLNRSGVIGNYGEVILNAQSAIRKALEG
jgi:hypothetical protein